MSCGREVEAALQVPRSRALAIPLCAADEDESGGGGGGHKPLGPGTGTRYELPAALALSPSLRPLLRSPSRSPLCTTSPPGVFWRQTSALRPDLWGPGGPPRQDVFSKRCVSAKFSKC